MRVLHINSNYIGSQLHQNMIEHFSRPNIINDVYVATYDKSISTVEVKEYVKVSECFNKHDRYIFYYKQSKIVKDIERNYSVGDFNLIHAYTLFTDGNAAMTLSKKYGVPYVVAIRNTDVFTFFKKVVYLRRRGVDIMLNAKAIFVQSVAYMNIVLAKYVPSKYKEIIRSKIKIISNGIDDYWLENKYKDRNHFEIEERLKEKDISIVYAGGIDRNKNLNLSIETINNMNSDGWNIKYYVAGKVKDKPLFEEIKDSIIYCGVKDKVGLIKLYRNADVFLMPSIHETFGLVYAEAMSQGLPVIYTLGQGFDKQFDEGVVGYPVSSSDCYQIEEALRRIFSDYTAISCRCIDLVDKFNWKYICDEYVQVYNCILSKS